MRTRRARRAATATSPSHSVRDRCLRRFASICHRRNVMSSAVTGSGDPVRPRWPLIIRIVIAVVAVVAPLRIVAQERGGSARVGVLLYGDATTSVRLRAALEDGFRELGYQAGRNIALEYRYAGADDSRFAALAIELVVAKVNVIITASSP